MASTEPVDSHRRMAQRIARRLEHRGHQGYARNKIRFDPAYQAVAGVLAGTRSDLLDVGCGLGLLGFYLREHGFRGRYLGLDFDARKIQAARAAACGHYADMHFQLGEAGCLPPFTGSVALIDMLHYLPAGAQQELLQAAAGRVAPGGMLVIRNVLKAPALRFWLTAIEEFFLHASRWMKTPASHYPTRAELEAPLHAAGLEVEARPLWGRTPFNSWLLVARRPLA